MGTSLTKSSQNRLSFSSQIDNPITIRRTEVHLPLLPDEDSQLLHSFPRADQGETHGSHTKLPCLRYSPKLHPGNFVLFAHSYHCHNDARNVVE